MLHFIIGFAAGFVTPVFIGLLIVFHEFGKPYRR